MSNAGRKSLWDELDITSKLDSITGWAKEGSTDEDMFKMLGVGHVTFYKWKKEKPEFAEAIKKGKEVSNGELLNSAFKQSTGYYYTEEHAVKVKAGHNKEKVELVEVEKYCQPVPVMNIFMLKNRMPDKYKDKQTHDLTGNLEIKVTLPTDD